MITTKITPRVYETDGAGHINNVFVPAWFEAGRREIFRILTPTLKFSDWRVVLVNMNVDYIDQIYFHNDVYVETGVAKIGNTSFTLSEELKQGARLCARGAATYVHFDYKLQKPCIITDEIRAALSNHLSAPIA